MHTNGHLINLFIIMAALADYSNDIARLVCVVNSYPPEMANLWVSYKMGLRMRDCAVINTCAWCVQFPGEVGILVYAN